MKLPRNLIPHDFKKRQLWYSSYKNKRKQFGWKKCRRPILASLRLLMHKNKSIVELGCNNGDLAVYCLNNLEKKYVWDGYDFNQWYLDHARGHERYHSHRIDTQIWETDIKRFDIFVSSHTIEHLFPGEVELLAEWLSKKCRYALLCIPLRRNKSPVKATHILGKGYDWLKQVFFDEGFRLVWELGHWFGWLKKT